MLLSSLIFGLALLAVVILPILYVSRREDYSHSRKTTMFVFFLGFIGWLLAYLRVIPITVYRLSLLMGQGIDPASLTPDQLATHPIIWTYQAQIIGPVLAGIVEELVRYLIIRQSVVKRDARYLPLVLGIGWASSEILLLSGGLIAAESTTLAFLFVLERTLAIVLHVTFSYLVVLAVTERPLFRKPSLYLALFLHFMIDSVIVVSIMENQEAYFDLVNNLGLVWMIQFALFVSLLVTVLITRFWYSRKLNQTTNVTQHPEQVVTAS